MEICKEKRVRLKKNVSKNMVFVIERKYKISDMLSS